ncbi:MAG: hypothetical protein KIT09_14895 [Bryobacteraceae bacterium]|nr:hypothetical protein [Bryobacteraceae bacterium]
MKTGKGAADRALRLERVAAKAAGRLKDEGWELPSGEGLTEFAVHAGFVASLLMASSAVEVSEAELLEQARETGTSPGGNRPRRDKEARRER